MGRINRLLVAVAGFSILCAAIAALAALPSGGDVASNVDRAGKPTKPRRSACGPLVATSSEAPLATRGKLALPPFSPSSPFNTPIPSTAVVSSSSAELVAKLAEVGRVRGFGVAVREWTAPVYFSTPATQPVTVPLTASFATRQVSRPIPIPRWARPDPEGDGHMVVIDTTTGCEHDFWRATRAADGTWSAAWQNSVPLAGNGVFPAPLLSARGSGFALTAGLIHPEELEAGVIEHALLFSYRHTKKGPPVWPATESDGQTRETYAMPMGSLLRLDPALDLGTLDLTPVERTIGRALQVYGMYLGDTGGAVSLYAVHPASYKQNPYGDFFESGPYTLLRKLPMERLQVLEPLNVRRSTGN